MYEPVEKLEEIGKMYAELYDIKELMRFNKIELSRIEHNDNHLLFEVLRYKSVISDLKSKSNQLKYSLALLVEEYHIIINSL